MAGVLAVIVNAYEELKRSISDDDIRTFTLTELKDVWTAVKDIDRKQREARCLERVEPLLERIKRFSKVMEEWWGLGTLYTPYIWAPIKLLLEIASQHRDDFDTLLSVYEHLGANLPRFERYETPFSVEFSEEVGKMYNCILFFHRRAYIIFRRRKWQAADPILLRDFWPGSDVIISSLKLQQNLLYAINITASSGVELRRKVSLEAELHRNQQKHTQPPVQVKSTSSRPIEQFGIAESEESFNNGQAVRQGCWRCFIIRVLWGVVVFSSIFIGLWRSFVTGDEGKGFTDAGYVIALGGIIVHRIQNRHDGHCKALPKVDD